MGKNTEFQSQTSMEWKPSSAINLYDFGKVTEHPLLSSARNTDKNATLDEFLTGWD